MTKQAQTHDRGADIDAVETREWFDAIDAVVVHDGPNRAQDLLTTVMDAPMPTTV
jgi:pyruvate dehydrogenase complex dehydrogenase (E1) component